MIIPIIERLEDQITGLRGRVRGVESLVAASEQVRALSAFVVFTGEAAGENPYGSQIHRQEVRYGFSVILAFPGAGANAQAALAQSEDLRTQVKQALTGWKHPDGNKGTRFTGAQVLGLSAGSFLLIGIEFSFDYYLEAA
ncbi:MAG: hypothetical protein ABL951_13105 [Alphaproteobacteria bacterium]